MDLFKALHSILHIFFQKKVHCIGFTMTENALFTDFLKEHLQRENVKRVFFDWIELRNLGEVCHKACC